MRTDRAGVTDPLDIERSAPAEIAPTVSPRDEIKALTGLRFVAACWVLMAHFQPVVGELWPAAGFFEPLSRDGNMGVDLFFILSGFILIYNYRETFHRVAPRPYFRFLGLRLARIYPVHLFVLGTFLVLAAVGFLDATPTASGEPAFTFAGFWKHLLLIQAWGFGDSATWNQPAWSLSAEWFAYLLFPFLALAILRFGSLKLIAGVALIGAPLGLFLMSVIERFPPFLALLRIGVTFSLGCFLGIMFLDGVGERFTKWHVVAGGAAIAIVAASLLLPDTCCAEYGSVIPLMCVLIFALARASGAPATWLSSERAMFWGGASYGLYMTHWLVLAIGAVLLPAELLSDESFWVRTLVVIAYLVAFFGAAAAIFVYVERPARRRLRDVMAAA